MPASRPPVLLQIAIEPRNACDRLRLVAALGANDDEAYAVDAESGQIILGGTSEEELDAFVSALRDRAGIPLNIGAPQIAYRESIGRWIEMDTTHKKPTSTGGFEFARVKLKLEPAIGWSFEAPSEAAFPEPFVKGVEAGLAVARRAGVLAGFPVVDLKATLVDGAWHDTDSSPRAFEIAARTALRLAMKEVGILLEPIMLATVTVPATYMRSARDDLHLRRGEIESRVDKDGLVTLLALVPLANLMGYSNSLRSLSQGTGSSSLAFSHFASMPRPDPSDFPGAMAMRA